MKTQVEVEIPDSLISDSASAELIELRKKIQDLETKLEKKTKALQDLRDQIKEDKENKKKLKELAQELFEACDACNLLELSNGD
jgi:predicted component of type VI protein secretion system